MFIFEFSVQPVTRRGMSMINSIFDPLGFLAPVTIAEKMVLVDIIAIGVD